MCKIKRNFDYAHFFCAGKKEKMNQLSKRFCGIIIAEKIKRKSNKNGTKNIRRNNSRNVQAGRYN